MSEPKPFGKQVLALFVLFFGAVIAANSVFLYLAVNTHTGVVTQNPYEKGLKYNETLEKAKSQPKLNEHVSYENGVLQWSLIDGDNRPIENANIKVKLVRLVKDGHDQETNLQYIANGVYETQLELPLSGQWEAHLTAQWNNKEYQTTHTFQVK